MYLAAYENTKCKPPNVQMTTYVEFKHTVYVYRLLQTITVYMPLHSCQKCIPSLLFNTEVLT